MKPLSEKLAQLSVQAKHTEDRAKKAQTEAKDRLEQQREKVREETRAALDKVNNGLSRASADAQVHARQLKTKVDSDFERLKQHADERKQKFEAWQANNYANDKEADAEALVDYAIASVKMAELGVLDAIDARLRAESKAEQIQPAQPTPA
jgi:hypothetical protein